MQLKAIQTDIILIDIISFSTLSIPEQIKGISDVASIFKATVKDVCEGSGILPSELVTSYIPTGDGFFAIIDQKYVGFGPLLGLSFMSEMEEYDLGPSFKGVRAAAHTGRLYPFEDIIGNTNYVGDGLNDTSRYVDARRFSISSMNISKDALKFMFKYIGENPRINEQVKERELKRGEIFEFYDKHEKRKEACTIWNRSAGIISLKKTPVGTI